ncbi:MAG: hypothetical protein AB4290_02990 [Spirulina sp.]
MLPLISEYAFQELKDPDNQAFEREARERWVKWYFDFARKYGGVDWREWDEQYKNLEKEWTNLQAVLKWCATKGRAEDVRDLWKSLQDYASLYGHWDDRIFWTSWLRDEFLKRGDWATVIYSMSSQGWTHTQKLELDKAERLLLDAWKLSSDQNFNIRSSLAKHIAYLYLRKRDYMKAKEWLNRERKILKYFRIRNKKRENVLNRLKEEERSPEKIKLLQNILDRSATENKHRLERSEINISYYEAEILFLKEKDYDRAKEKFEEVFKNARDIHWLRRANYAQHWLGDIAIKQNRLEDAKKLLDEGYKIARRNNEKCYMAYYENSFAHLFQKLEQLAESRRWAESAKKNFHLLGMEKDEEKMESFLNSLT